MKEFIIVANLKYSMLPQDILVYLKNIENCKSNLIVCPPNIYIPYFLKHNYLVGIQHLHYAEKPYTGEITPEQVHCMGIRYVIIGHSDRRLNFNESDTDINKTVIKCLNIGLKVILCVGEKLEERNMLKTSVVLKKQLTIDLKNVKNLENLYIAYEPVWAIGTDNTPNNQEINDTVAYIKEIVLKQNNCDVKVLYGGSINEENIEMIKKTNIDGIIIGKSSYDSNDLLKILEKIETVS